MALPFDPFSPGGRDEVPLERAPLVRVIAQIRFPPIASLGRADFMAPFQEAIRARYPILTPERTAGFMFGPQGVMLQNSDGVVWRFHDKLNTWSVSLGPDFVALESTAYTDRDDFFGRFDEIVRALDQVAKLPVYLRLGVRYINRVRGPELETLPVLVRPEVLGLAGSMVTGFNHSICESLFTQEDVALSTRWGRLPSGTTTDPAALLPIDEPSWVLDLDMFRAAQRDFDAAEVLNECRRFAETIHGFFRWCVLPKFLDTYGAKR